MNSDYVIVGGGIYGAGAAWELARRGADVTLLEADEIASGASGGMGKRGIRANGRDPRTIRLMELAYDRWPSLSAEIDAETGYERTGHLIVYEEEHTGMFGGFASAEPTLRFQRRRGIETELLDRDAVRDLEPYVNDSVIGGLYCPTDGVADQTSTTRGLAGAAERNGATIHEGSPVSGVEMRSDVVEAVLTEDGSRVGVGDTVVLLSNAHVPGLVEKEFGLTLPVWSVLPQVVRTGPLEVVPVEHMVVHDSRPVGVKALDGSRLMIAGGRCGRLNLDTGVGEVIPEEVERAVADAVALFPVLEGVTVEVADASRAETVSIDRQPVIDRVPHTRNVVIGTGWSGHGFAIAPAVNQLLAEWLLEGTRPTILDPFRWSRFS